jgi:hypothetical protein
LVESVGIFAEVYRRARKSKEIENWEALLYLSRKAVLKKGKGRSHAKI